MDTFEENLYNRARKEKLVRAILCTCILFNVALSLVTMIVQFMCDHLADHHNNECKPDISKIGFGTLNELFNTFPLCSLISQILNGVTFLVVVSKFFQLYYRHFKASFDEVKGRALKFIILVASLVLARSFVYYELSYQVFDREDEASYLLLKVCKITMVFSELIGSYLIVILTFKNSEESNVMKSQ